MKIVLVRHGRPDEDDMLRSHDPGLRADGRRQACAVAARLAAEGVTRGVSSPMRRALDTAEPLARRLQLPVETVDGWAEADRHRDRYRSTETLRALGDAAWQRFLDDPIRYLGGDPQTFHAAVMGALHGLVESTDADATVAVFTHGLPINLVLSQLLGLERITHFQPGYGSITRLRARNRSRIGIISVNESGHLAPPIDPLP